MAAVFEFQFHKGTIKTMSTRFDPDNMVNFNSIKVQLKLDGFGGVSPLILFQFHKGTIKTRGRNKKYIKMKISIP